MLCRQGADPVNSRMNNATPRAAVIGGGPAGLMAAEVLSRAGVAATDQGMVPRAQAAHRLMPVANALKKIPGVDEESHNHGHTANSSEERDK